MTTNGLFKWIALAIGTAAVGVVGYFLFGNRPDETAAIKIAPPPSVRTASFAEVNEFCGTVCHAYPPPDSFPKANWRKEVEQGYYFADRFRPDLKAPDKESVIAHYESLALIDLPFPERVNESSNSKIIWGSEGVLIPNRPPLPEVVNIKPAILNNDGKVQLIVVECDPLKNEGRVMLFNPHANPPTWKEIAKVPAPAHVEVVDLDGDGHLDIIVACLGIFFPKDEKKGSVVWLRGKGDETFESITLLSDIGRVADVQAADFNGDGKLDLVVAEFGWRALGSIILLENQTTDWSKPKFVSKTLDDRHGTINVPVADLNGDGKPDFVALISQEHETVVAFINEGEGKFRKEVIYAAPHPAYGSSGIQLVDMDGDGDLDVIYTNGDVLDKPFVLKPYHGVHLLENEGKFPFVHHRLANMPGVMRAVAADVDGDGDMDVIAVGYLPAEEFPKRDAMNMDSVLWLEQTSKGKFVRRPLETKTCDHLTCAFAELQPGGLPSLVVGNFWSTDKKPFKESIKIWTPRR